MNKTKTLYVAWQAPTGRRWFPIGRLTYDGELYRYSYTKGALQAQKTGEFEPLQAFPDLKGRPESKELFPFFENRVMKGNRPEYGEFVDYLNLENEEHDPIALLGRSGGRRATDSLEVFLQPEPDQEGHFHIHFFVHGLSHFPKSSLRRIPKSSLRRISRLEPGEKLMLVHDLQNDYDSNALALRTAAIKKDHDRRLLGWLPRYLTDDVASLLKKNQDQVKVRVERVNQRAPLQLRLLCSLTADWPSAGPFSSEQYQPLD